MRVGNLVSLRKVIGIPSKKVRLIPKRDIGLIIREIPTNYGVLMMVYFKDVEDHVYIYEDDLKIEG